MEVHDGNDQYSTRQRHDHVTLDLVLSLVYLLDRLLVSFETLLYSIVDVVDVLSIER